MNRERRKVSLSVKVFVTINLIVLGVSGAGLAVDVMRQYRSYHGLLHERLLDEAQLWRLAWVRAGGQPESFEQWAQSFRGPPSESPEKTRFVMIVAPDGDAAMPAGFHLVGLSPPTMSPAMRQLLLAHASVPHTMVELEGHKIMAVSVAVGAGASSRERIVIAEHVDELDKVIRGEIASRLAFAVVMVLWVMALVNLLLNRWVARPVRQLSQSAGRLAAGHYDQPIRTTWGTRELDELANSFERARRRLHQIEQRRSADLARARRTQEALLPSLDAPLPGLVVAGHYRPASDVGGDLYDLRRWHDGGTLAVIGDVSGHGVAAALIMTMVKTDLEHLVGQGPPRLGDLVARLNRDMLAISEPVDFLSLLALWLDVNRGVAGYLNAGHPAGLLLRPDGSIRRLDATGPLIGISDLADQWDEATFHIDPGDRFVLITDGVLELEDEAGQPYGTARLEQWLAGRRQLPAGQLVGAFKEELARWIGSAVVQDDLTLLVVDYAGPPSEPVSI